MWKESFEGCEFSGWKSRENEEEESFLTYSVISRVSHPSSPFHLQLFLPSTRLSQKQHWTTMEWNGIRTFVDWEKVEKLWREILIDFSSFVYTKRRQEKSFNGKKKRKWIKIYWRVKEERRKVKWKNFNSHPNSNPKKVIVFIHFTIWCYFMFEQTKIINQQKIKKWKSKRKWCWRKYLKLEK